MPMILPVIGMALLQLGPLTLLGNVIAYSLIASSVVTADRQRRKAARKAIDAYNASLRDQLVMVKGGVTPRDILYGRVAKSGAIVYATSTGSKKEFLHMVIALGMGEIDAVEQLYFNDELAAWDATAGASALTPVGGRFTKAVTSSQNVTATVPASAPYNVTAPGLSGNPSSVVLSGGGGGDNGALDQLLQLGTDYTVSGTTVTFNAAFAGKAIAINYETTASGTVFAWVRWYAGTDTQTADPDLVAAAPSEWTSNHRLRGVAYLYVRLYFDETIWATGVPNIKAIVRGRKVFDPRSSTTVWTRNPALIARNYILSAQGLNVASSKVPNAAVITAANICDELVQLSNGSGTLSFTNGSPLITGSGTSFDQSLVGKNLVGPVFGWIGEVVKVNSATSLEVRYNMGATASGVAWNPNQTRYLCDGVVSTGANRRDNLDKICDSMAGRAWYSQGQWLIRAGAGGTPTLTIGDDDVSDAESITISPFSSRRDLLNGAKATIIDAAKGYIENQAPEWSSSTLLSQDNNVKLIGALSLPMTTDAAMAQRLLKIMVLRTREAMMVRAAFKLTQFRVGAGDLVSLTMTRFGIFATTFRVLERSFSPDGGIVLTMREELQSVYDWNLGEAVNLATVPNASLPNYFFVPAPVISGVQSGPQWAVKRGDGSVDSRVKISITAPFDQSVISGGKLQIQYRDAANSWKYGKTIDYRGDTTEAYLENMVPYAVIEIKARYMNNIGAYSNWSQTVVYVVVSPYGASITSLRNLLKNSDFTDYAGTDVGTIALRSWVYGATNAFDGSIARNHSGGQTWNNGRGGASLYNTNFVGTNEYQILYQDVAATEGVRYEAAFVGSAHRCRVRLQMEFKSAGGSVLGTSTDEFDAGASIRGGAMAPDYGLWWVSGVAPAGTVSIRLILLKFATNSGQINSYAFFNKVRLYAVKTAGTRDFPLPWVDGGSIGTPGGGIDPGTVDTPILTPNAATEIYENTTASGNPAAWDQQAGGNQILGFNKIASLVIACKAGDRLICHGSVVGTTGNNATWAYPNLGIDVYAGSGILWAKAVGARTNNLQEANLPLQPTNMYYAQNMTPYQYTVTADGNVTVQAGGGLTQGTSNTESGYVKLRVERIKR